MGYLDSLAHWYDMSDPVGLPDLGVVGGNPGTGANIASNPDGVGGGIAAEFNGNNSNYNCGDIVELNSVSAFTIAFWMNQDVIAAGDFLFMKTVDGSNELLIWTGAGPLMHFECSNGGTSEGNFDYSAQIAAGAWAHVAMAFDGSQINNASRLIVYVNAVPVTLAFTNVIPATTGDYSGIDAIIGAASAGFDGRLDEFMIFSAALTNIQVADTMLRSRRGMLRP